MSRSVKPKIRRRVRKIKTRTKVANWFAGLIGAQIRKTKSVVPDYVFDPEPKVRHPTFDYVSLFEVATTSWLLRRCFRAIIQECMRNRWGYKARFKWKCTNEKCGKEFNSTPKDKKCDACGSDIRNPYEAQARILEKIMKRPNRDYKFDDFVRSSIFYDLSLDDWYWYIRYKFVPEEDENGRIIIENKKPRYKRVPDEVYIEDARFIFPVADDYGHLGNDEYFCPICYNAAKGDLVEDLTGRTEEEKKNAQCQLCGKPLLQTAYVQEIGGEVTARYGKDEIVHGSSSRVLPALFGNSKIITLWKVVMTLMSMDDYNWEVYSEGKVGSILGFPGEDQVEVNVRKKKIEQELQRLDERDIQTGRRRTSKKIRTMMIGLRKDTTPVRIPIMESLKDMQSIEFYKLYSDAISGVYGVTPEFVSITTPFSGVELKINVQNRTTQDHQSNFVDLFNDDLLEIFGITDWIMYFKSVETKDELRLEQVGHTRAAAALTWLRGGFIVSIDEETGKLVVSGKGELPNVESGPGSRMGQLPRGMEGKPRDEVAGNPMTGAGERLQLSKTIMELGEGGTETTPPLAPEYEKASISDRLKRIVKWASKEVKSKKRRKSTIVSEALAKADQMVTRSSQELINRAITHAQRRTGIKRILLSPEELKRLETYKENIMSDFEKILKDSLKGR